MGGRAVDAGDRAVGGGVRAVSAGAGQLVPDKINKS